MTSVADSGGRTVSYDYDSTGNRTALTTPIGETLAYTYDESNRLTAIEASPFGKRGEGATFGFTYDPLGRRIGVEYPNNVTAAYAYDEAGRLTGIVHNGLNGAVIASNAYTHDNVGNRLTNETQDRTAAYLYDDIYRLTEALSSTPGWSGVEGNGKGKGKGKGKGSGIENAIEQQKEYYAYDPVGNRVSSEKTDSYGYNAGNRLVSSGAGGEAISYLYDRNGNLASKTGDNETVTYGYDYENRLVKVTKTADDAATTVEFKYDPFGRRIEKKITEDGITSTIKYFYDNEDILFEYDEDGNTGNYYVHGPGIDEPLALINNKGTLYYHADGLGTIVALTDERGGVVQEYEYDSFGNLKDQKNRIKQPYTYTSREWDRETGLYYYRARYYDAEVGRFTTKDPIGFEGGDVNLYGYIGNNPINKKDPLGLKEKENDGKKIKEIVGWCLEWYACRSARTAYCESKFGSPCRAGCGAKYDQVSEGQLYDLCIVLCGVNSGQCQGSAACPYDGIKMPE